MGGSSGGGSPSGGRRRLRPEQESLLDALCRAATGVDGDFRLMSTLQGKFIKHPGLPEPLRDFSHASLNELQAQRLIRLTHKSGSISRFELTNTGWDYWEALQGAGVQRVEDEVRRLLDGAPTDGPYAAAFGKWAVAERLLWDHRESPERLTEVGHVSREVMQAFADAFCADLGEPSDLDPAKTVARIRAGVDALRPGLSERYAAFLDALLAYWGTVSDLVQRLEHGAGKEEEPIDWEDARLVVTQTVIVMSELVRAPSRVRRG